MKRYVLLEHGNIVDTKDRPLFHIEKNTLWHNSMLQGAILNQSDNIIDLAEVGDCVETVDTIEKVTRIKGIYCFTSGSHLIGVSRITALWKRNGDVMRRYER